MNARKIISSVAAAMIAAIVLAVTLAPAMASQPPDEDPCTIMHPDIETLMEWKERYNSAPQINRSGGGLMAYPEYSVLDHLDYNATERDQGSCGNCWVWTGTGCMEVAHNAENGVFDRLSIQYLNSLYYDGTGEDHACCGGNLGKFTDFYSVNTAIAVPWNNTNASWQDGSVGCSGNTTVPAASIATTPHYKIVNIEEFTIATHEVGQDAAIANIKSVLDSDNAIWFAFYLPNTADWNNFYNFWDSGSETLWSPDYSCGHTWVDGEGGGHAVLCVGYNDTDPGNRYWVMLNSWGTAGGNRPNGLFRMNMSINYSCCFDYYGQQYTSLDWQMLDIDFADICVNETGWWRNNATFNASGTPIQSAVGNAGSGDMIYVCNGSYTENVDISITALTLQGEGADAVTVTAASSDDHVFDVTADWVNISGFTATGATGLDSAGINLCTADHCNISDNNVTNNDCGIYLESSSYTTMTNNNASNNAFYGIYIESSSYNSIRNNAANDCSEGYGIHLYTSGNNTLANNTASNNYLGIYLEDSSNNTLTNSTMSGNAGNFGVYGSSLPLCIQNIDTSNLVDGKPIYYWVNQHNQQVPDDAGYVGVVNSTNITVRDLVLTNNSEGMVFAYTNNSRIENVTVTNNSWGICLECSHNNTLTNNTANSNYDYGVGFGDGISLTSSSNNTLTNNTALNNDCDGIDLYSSNNNTLANNNASNNAFYGIYLWASNNNTLTSNTANSNNQRGIYLTSSNDNTVTNNTLSSNIRDIYVKNTLSTFTNNTLSGTTISFTYSGDVSLKGANSPAADPTGRQSIGRFINATKQSADAWLFLNFSYSDSDVSGMDESSLAVWKYNGTWYEDGWNGTRYLNTTANIVGVNITSFSVFAPMVPLPDITSCAPETPVSDEPNATRTFNITVDRIVNVTWYINETIVQDTNTSVTDASYTNTSAALGVWNVSAVVNNANGADMQTWIWNVALSGDVTGDGVVNIGDAVLLFNWVSFPNERETTYALTNAGNADVTGNGVVNIGDATLLFNWVSFEGERGTTYVLK